MKAGKLYRIYIDESGDHTYGKKELRDFVIKSGEKVIKIPDNHYPALEVPDKRYLGLTSIIIEAERYKTNFYPALESLKQKHFPHSPDESIILERNEIINRRGPFWRLKDSGQETAFNDDLLSFLQSQEYTIITVVIDKKSHIERYYNAFHPYHYCLAVMLERYRGFLHYRSAKGDVLAESRGGTEDKLLKAEYQRIYNEGTLKQSATHFQTVLTSKEIKIKPKIANISGLQIADILAHSSKQKILIENNVPNILIGTFGKTICTIIGEKYCRHLYKKKKIYGKVFLK